MRVVVDLKAKARTVTAARDNQHDATVISLRILALAPPREKACVAGLRQLRVPFQRWATEGKQAYAAEWNAKADLRRQIVINHGANVWDVPCFATQHP
jgi:hypothetical protein